MPITSFSIAEVSSLPTISVKSRGYGETQFQAYVNAYVVSEHHQYMKSGHARYALWYLSLIGLRGQGTTLQAIYSSLVSTNAREMYLEGIGDVTLGSRREDLIDQGYSTHWNYEQAELTRPGSSRFLHGILEPRMLTTHDPLRALAMVKTRRQGSKSSTTTKKKRQKETVSLSSVNASGSGSGADAWEELRAREEHPFFLLLVPGDKQGDTSFCASLYSSFLDKRLPWPLTPEWAGTLWKESQTRGEIEKLVAWSYPMPQDEKESSKSETTSVPMISEAYLCRPNVAKVARSMQGIICATSGGASSEQREEVAA